MIKLVDYSESSDDEELAEAPCSNDGSQWSSFGEVPSSPSDTFSYDMRSPDSEEEIADDEEEVEDDEEEDEDYVPSRTSLDASVSITSSVDTEDLDPDNDMEEEEPVEMEDNLHLNTQEEFDYVNQEKNKEVKQCKDVLNVWKDLKDAFEANAFKRRSGEISDNMEKKILPKTTKQQQLLSTKKWTSFADDKEQSTMSKNTAADYMFKSSKTSPNEPTNSLHVDGQTKQPAFCSFQTPQVDISTFSFGGKQMNVHLPNFTFGNSGATVFAKNSDDTHMRSPSPKCTTATSFVPIDGKFTLEKRGNKSIPNISYNFGNNASKAECFCAKVQNTTNDDNDAYMYSPSTHGKPAGQYPTKGEFLFGQAYKNRKPHDFFRQKSSVSLEPTKSVFTPIVAPTTEGLKVLWGTKGPIGGTLSYKSGANSEDTAVPTSFSTGVAGSNMQHRNLDRQKKKAYLCSTFASIAQGTSSKSQLFVSTSSFGSSQSATATHQQFDTIFAVNDTQEKNVWPSNMASTVPTEKPFVTSTGGSFILGNLSNKTVPKTFTNTDSSLSQADEFGSAIGLATVAAVSSGVSRQISLDEETSCNSFKFGDAETNLPTVEANARFPAKNISAAPTGGFQIGCVDAQTNSRVRHRRSGMFTHKNSPRKDAKVGALISEPSSGSYSASSSTPSPFRMHHRRTRKNACVRKCGRSSPTKLFATHNFQCHQPLSSSDGHLHPNAVGTTVTRDSVSVAEASSPSNSHFGVVTSQQHDQISDSGVFSFHSQRSKSSDPQSQNSNHKSTVCQHSSSESAKIQQSSNSGTRSTYAGSRRILRAALRSVGVGGDRASSAPPTTGSRPDENDADMDSEDERDWLELKRLGGVAYCAKKYEDAAEYYRQSIELLDSLSYHDTVMYTTEMRTDKAKLHANRAASLMMLMHLNEAQRECQRSIEVDATYARAYLRLGRIQVLLGDATNAQANIDTARQLMEGSDHEVSTGDQADYASLTKIEASIKKLTMLQGEIKWYVDCGDFKQALVQTNAALVHAPNSRKLQVEKARILLHQKKLGEIVELCTSIIEKQQANQGETSSPASTSGMNTKAVKGKTVQNIAYVGIELGLLWATTLHYQDKVEDAVQILDALEVVAPCSSHVIQLKRQWQDMKQLKHDGNERYKQGNYQEAVRFYSEAVQIDPQHQEYCAIIYCNRSAAQMGLGRYHTAILDCNQALQQKPNYPRALLRRARCHVALKMYHEAVKDFDQYLRVNPSVTPVDAPSDVRRERNEAKAAIAKFREEANQREAAKKRAERQQRQRRQHQSHQRDDSTRNDSRFRDNFQRDARSNNGEGHGSSRFQSSGANSRASYMAPKTQRRTHYDVLGIEKTATMDQIRRSYRKLALVYHPDKAKTLAHANLFKEMTAAYNVLSDESARAKYNRELIYHRFGNFNEN
ncbi:unnamed protein product [Peronospora belbahrii]|uniref:J domain-containing protein n=1 Tax=Peronospora belbahrii TaxID=622444 RepID=A0AAU9L1J7_9STRA|nr:unnamed protein product [Peronospora belbahrii]